MQSKDQNAEGFARQLPLSAGSGTEGALIADNTASDDRIVVLYDHGAPPPEITISQTAGQIQTVLANGVAVAVIARSGRPRLTAQDVVLVERFVSDR
ncbi:hypothetical protein [Roseobacter weihaiensis]|uniref:hypothetical protein n=1 Tax=Roseobacter weihaiensis TaxID=2763262 RepID=UPI001D0AD921|nr:hypothetical protein [Roseobacter sp. H9]